MSLMRWQPLKEIDALREQMNHLFDDWMHSANTSNLFRKLSSLNNLPAIELKETDTDLILSFAVPGMDAKDLDIQVSEDAVSITGEYKEEKIGEATGVFHSEFSYGEFKRIVSLPVNVKHDQVKAELNSGVVTLTLPKADATKRNVVKVNLIIPEKASSSMDTKLSEEKLDTREYTNVPEEARNAMTERRQHEEHLKNMDV